MTKTISCKGETDWLVRLMIFRGTKHGHKPSAIKTRTHHRRRQSHALYEMWNLIQVVSTSEVIRLWTAYSTRRAMMNRAILPVRGRMLELGKSLWKWSPRLCQRWAKFDNWETRAAVWPLSYLTARCNAACSHRAWTTANGQIKKHKITIQL
jgi:hypothetical protein